MGITELLPPRLIADVFLRQRSRSLSMNLSGGLAGVVGRTLRVSRQRNRTCGPAGRLSLPVEGPNSCLHRGGVRSLSMNLSGGPASVVGRTLRVSRRWNRTCGSVGRLSLPVEGPSSCLHRGGVRSLSMNLSGGLASVVEIGRASCRERVCYPV